MKEAAYVTSPLASAMVLPFSRDRMVPTTSSLSVVSLSNLVFLDQLLTVVEVGEDQVVPFPQNSSSLCSGGVLLEISLSDIGGCDGVVKVLDFTVGDLAEDTASGGLCYGCESRSTNDIRQLIVLPETSNVFAFLSHLPLM
jgi:hypothetical protein